MAFDAFIQLDGIEGESTRNGFEGWIELESFSFGARNPSTIGSGGGGGAGKAELGRFNFSKTTDKASPIIFQNCCAGRHYPKVKVVLHKSSGEDAALDYLVYEFERVFVESIDWQGQAGASDRPYENVSLAFGKVKITYTPQTETGAKGSPVIGSWDVTAVSR